MFLSNHLTILLLLVSCFPLLLQCWNMKLNPKETIRPYVDEEKNEKVADRQREIDYAQRHRFGNHRYTLTVYNPGYPRLHGLIVSHHNGLVTGFPDVEVKCPKKKLFSPCPRSNHTRTVFHGKLRPSIGARRPQVLYAAKKGYLRLTKLWATNRPRKSVTAEHGWTWHSIPLPFGNRSATFCHEDNPIYDCSAPTGYFTYWLPMDPNWMSESFEDMEHPPPSWSGVFLCPGLSKATDWVLDDAKDVGETMREALSVVVFSRYVKKKDVGGCMMVDGLATVEYEGPDPPVYEYV